MKVWLGIITLMLGLAQPAEIPLRIVAITDEGIAFFEVSASGAREAVGEPLGNFAVESYDGSAEWMILAKESFAVSPDGSRIAFTAQRDDEAALFIYTIADGSLTQHPIVSYWLIPTWSPDSEAVMLNVASPYWGDFPPPDDYVYDIATASLFQITFTEEIEVVIQWSVDGSRILYLGWCNPDNCGNPTRDLYLVSRDGTTRFPLTDFPAQLPPGMSPSGCFPTWSPEQERWYYAVGCGNFMQVDRSYIYSTDVNGNNRLEFSLEDYLRLAEGSDIKLDYGIAKGIHPRPEGIYISAEFSFFHDSDLHPDLAGITQYEWRVLRLATTGQLEAVYHQFAFTEASGSVMSPDGQRMVLISFDSAFVIDVTNNQDIGVPPGLETPGETAVCDVRWLDNETIVYNVGGHICRGVRYTSPQGARLMNVVTGEVTVLTEGLAGPAWVLPIPQVEQLAPPSLTAHAGPDQTVNADGSGFASFDTTLPSDDRLQAQPAGSLSDVVHVTSMAWNSDGTTLAISGVLNDQRGIWFYNAASGVIGSGITFVPLDRRLTWSPDDTMIAGYSSNEIARTLIIFRVADGSIVSQFEVGVVTMPITWSPDSSFILIGKFDDVMLYNVLSGLPERVMHIPSHFPRNGGISSTAWDTDNARVYGAYAIKDLLVWNSATAELITNVEFPNGVTFPIALDTTGDVLAIHGYHGEVFLVNPFTLQVISTLQAPNDEVIRDVVWHEDNIHLVTFGGDRIIRVWNTKTGEIVETIQVGELISEAPVWRPGTNELTYSPVNASPVIIVEIESIPAATDTSVPPMPTLVSTPSPTCTVTMAAGG